MRKTLGLDFGHCEVAVSLCIDGKKPENLILDGSKAKVIPAQIALSQEQIAKSWSFGGSQWDIAMLSQLGEIAIGDDAAPKNDDSGTVINFMYFKKAPEYFDELFEDQVPRGLLMAAFLYQLVNQIFEYNPDYLGEEDRREIELLVGCPTTQEWTSKSAVKRYTELISRATGIRNVRIVPESRAAMFSSIESAQTRVSAAGGAMVFDFGSSTADCTYMLLGRKCMEFSWRLGAQAIEAQMARVAFDGQKPSLTSRVYVTNQLRKQKELYYAGTFGPKGQRLIYDVMDKDGNDIEAYIRVNDKQMEEVTAGEDHEIEIVCDSMDTRVGTWQALCREFFLEAKDRLDAQDLPYSDVVLTGGASKMTFVREYCREIFGDSVEIHVEKNPSFSVANGLGWVSSIDARVPGIIADSRAELMKNQSISINQLKSNIAVKLQKIVADITKVKAKTWADIPEDRSFGDLIDMISNEISSETIQNKILNIMEQELSAWKISYKDAVRNLVNRNTASLMTEKIAEGVILTDDVWESLQASNLAIGAINVKKILDDIDLNSMLNSVLQGAISWTFLLIGMEIGGPLGAAIAWLIAQGINVLLHDNNVQKPRNQSYRQKLKDKIINAMNKPDRSKKIEESLTEYLKDIENKYPQIMDSTLKTAYEIVTLSRFEK